MEFSENTLKLFLFPTNVRNKKSHWISYFMFCNRTETDSGIKYKPENCETTANPCSDGWSICSSQALKMRYWPLLKEEKNSRATRYWILTMQAASYIFQPPRLLFSYEKCEWLLKFVFKSIELKVKITSTVSKYSMRKLNYFPSNS